MQFQTKVAFIKMATQLIVGTGASIIVKTIIKNNNVVPDKRTAKVCVAAATVILGWMAADAAGRYTDREISAAARMWTRVQEKLHPAN